MLLGLAGSLAKTLTPSFSVLFESFALMLRCAEDLLVSRIMKDRIESGSIWSNLPIVPRPFLLAAICSTQLWLTVHQLITTARQPHGAEDAMWSVKSGICRFDQALASGNWLIWLALKWLSPVTGWLLESLGCAAVRQKPVFSCLFAWLPLHFCPCIITSHFNTTVEGG